MKKIFLLMLSLSIFVMKTPVTTALSISGYQASQIVITAKGSDGNILMGRTAPVAQFLVQNRGDKNLALEYLNLKNYGNADLTESFGRWQVLINGQTVQAWIWTERKNIRMVFPEPVIIGRGDSVRIEIAAQLIGARTNRDVQLGLRRSDDIDLREINTGAYGKVITDTPIKFATQKLRPGGINIRRQSRRTFRR
jgi:hypothetical protein